MQHKRLANSRIIVYKLIADQFPGLYALLYAVVIWIHAT